MHGVSCLLPTLLLPTLLAQGLVDEATFYDKQWQATWEGTTRPSEKET